MAEIPERWKHHIIDPQPGDGLLRKCIEELGTAEARIRELEQELEGKNTFYRGQSTLVGRISDELESLEAQLQAVTQERDQMKAALTIIRDHTYTEGMQRSFAAAVLPVIEKAAQP
jgi:chromosome segregation ATPase